MINRVKSRRQWANLLALPRFHIALVFKLLAFWLMCFVNTDLAEPGGKGFAFAVSVDDSTVS